MAAKPALRAVPGATPREPPPGEYDAPVLRRNKWLEGHYPRGTVGPPAPGQLNLEAAVNGEVIATAYDDLGKLMDAADEAEAGGRCPLHLPDGSCRLAPAEDSWYEESTQRIAILEREFSYPVVAVCKNCHGRIRRTSPEAEWAHADAEQEPDPGEPGDLRPRPDMPPGDG